MEIRIQLEEKSYTEYMPFEIEAEDGKIYEGVVIENGTSVGGDMQVTTELEWNTEPPDNKDALRIKVLETYSQSISDQR